MPNALIVDDDPSTVLLLSSLFERHGFTTASAQTLAQARDSLDTHPDVCIVDLCLPDGRGTELLDSVDRGKTDFVMLTGHASVESSVDAMRRGACDYLTKPLSRDAFNRIVARFKPAAASITPPTEAGTQIVGESPAMRRLLHQIVRVGRSDATVLIVGESGTGKELIAARLHELSPRAKGRYLALNCGAVSPNLIESELFGHEKGSFTGASRQHSGYFERAHGGTLFLDEVTEMPFDLQVRLLRVLETRRVTRVGSSESIPINVRVIAATNRDPNEAVRQGKLREDLLYRLQVVPIEVPPLRMRTGDVRRLALHFLSLLNASEGTEKTLSEAALQRLESYTWPGNVRELYNVVQRAFILNPGTVINHPGLPRDARSMPASGLGVPLSIRLGESLASVEQRHILHTMRNCRTQEEAARMLGVSTKTLYNKLRLYKSGRGNGQSAPGAEPPRAPAAPRPADLDEESSDTTLN
jgi:two-component system response regulator AtoC